MRDTILETITETRPISPNKGYELAVSGSFAGAGVSDTSDTGAVTCGSGIGGSLLATATSTGFSLPCSSTTTTGAVFNSASVSTTTAGTGAWATLAISTDFVLG